MSSNVPSGTVAGRIDWLSAALLGPFIVLVVFAFLLPLLGAVRSALEVDAVTSRAGYLVLIEDPVFRAAVWRTVMFALVVTGVQVGLANFAAAFLARRLPLPALVAGLSVPASISPPVAALMWRLLLEPTNGALAHWLPRQQLLDWTLSPLAAQALVAFVDTWQWLPLLTLVVALWMSRVDDRLLAMAFLDGAPAYLRAWRVIVRPMLPLIGLMAAFRFADLVRLFDIPFVLTRGGPGSATEFLAIYSYRYSLEFFRPAVGTAAGLVAFLLALGPNVAILLRRREVEAQ